MGYNISRARDLPSRSAYWYLAPLRSPFKGPILIELLVPQPATSSDNGVTDGRKNVHKSELSGFGDRKAGTTTESLVEVRQALARDQATGPLL